jgi:hypothetical protein
MLRIGKSASVVRLSVRNSEIQGWLQNKQLLDVNIEASEMPVRHAVSSDCGPVSCSSVRAAGAGGRGA